MHSKHGTTIICADHTKWSHQIQRYDNSLSKLGLIPTFNSLVKKKQKKTFICDTFEYDTMAMKFWLDSAEHLLFDSLWSPEHLGMRRCLPTKYFQLATGGLEKQNRVGSDILFYNLFDWCWCYFVSFDKESIFKSCMRTVRPSGFESALTPVYFNDKVKLKWLSSVL